MASDQPLAREVLFRALARGNEEAVTELLALDPPLISPATLSSHYSDRDWSACTGPKNLVLVQMLTKWPDLISIFHAAQLGYDEVLNVVLSRNPQPSLSKNDRNRTALIAAVIGDHESTVALLLAKDPELIHVVNPSGETPLHFAKKASIAKQLLDHKPELINAMDSRGWTALHSAICQLASMEVLDFLLERRIPGLSDAVDGDALHFAVLHDHKEAFFKLVAHDPRLLDVVTLENRNILHCTAQTGDPQMLDTILDLGPELACGVDASGNTALHCLFRGRGKYCIVESHWEKIWQLNPSALRAVNKHLQTPSMIAIGRGYLRDKELSLTRKLSWDELIADHEAIKLRRRDLSEKLNKKLQVSRKFAEEQCESGLSSALFIPGVIDIVKSYIFFAQQEVEQEDERSVKRHKGGDDEYWCWVCYDEECSDDEDL